MKSLRSTTMNLMALSAIFALAFTALLPVANSAAETSVDEYLEISQQLGKESPARPATYEEAAHEAAVGLQGYPYSKKIGWFVPQEPTWGSVYADPGWREKEGNDRWFEWWGFGYRSWPDGYIDMWIQATLVETLVNYDWISGDSLKNSIPLKVVYDFWSKKSRAFKKVHNDLFDDKLWWVMMYLRLHEVFDDVKYLEEAERWWNQAIMNPNKPKWYAWDDKLCGGGVRWGDYDKDDARYYHNSVTNGLFLTVSARLAAYHYLHNNRKQAEQYAVWAEKEWEWFSAGTGSKLWKSQSEPLLIDGIMQKSPQSAITRRLDLYTYNQGLIIYGMASLARMYFNKGETDKVQSLCDRIDAVFMALVESGDLSTTVVNKKTGDAMRVLLDSSKVGKIEDLVAFKGCTVRHLMATLQIMRKLNPKGSFAKNAPTWFRNQATAIMQYNMAHPISERPEYNPWYFGYHWEGPANETVMAATQAGALDAFNAALWVKQGFPLPPARLFK